MVKLVGWCESVQSGSQKSHGHGISIKVRLAIANKKNPSSIPSCAPDIPYVLPKIPPQKSGVERCDSRSIFFLVPIHRQGINKKKHLDGITKFLLGWCNKQKHTNSYEKIGIRNLYAKHISLLPQSSCGFLQKEYGRKAVFYFCVNKSSYVSYRRTLYQGTSQYIAN